MTHPETPVLRFGVFELDLKSGELRRSGMLVKLQPQPFRVLALLAARPNQVVTREEIQQQIWGEDTFVDFERGLNFCIKQIRTALDDDAETPRYIETLPKRGYRFLVPVEPIGQEPPAPAPTPAPPMEPSPSVEAPAEAARRPSRWVASFLAVGVVLAVVGYFFRDRVIPKPRGGKIMLVVLPFENLSADPEQEYFSDGLTEELITQLGRLNPDQLGVIARTSAMRYKDTNKSIDEIGRELRVDYVLEGSVRRSHNRVRITAQLIQVSDRTHLWAEPYERSLDLADVLSIQRDVASRTVNSLALELLPAGQAVLAHSAPVNPDAYQDYLKGRFHWNKRALQKSLELFEQAVAKDPEFALGHAALAEAYGLLGSSPYDVLPPRLAQPKAKAAALKALALDHTLAEAHSALAHAKVFYDWDWRGAEGEFQQAIELNPGYATARQWYAEYLWAAGRPGEALPQIQQALQRDPYSVVIRLAVGRHYYLTRHYEQAIAHYRETVEMEPEFAFGHFDLGLAYLQAGRAEEAVAESQRAVELSPDNPLCLAALGYVYARTGRVGEARQLLHQLQQLSRQRYVPALYLAGVYAGLGEKEQAFQWLEKAYEERSTYLINLNLEPPFDDLRSDPRFQNLTRRLGLPPK